VAEVMLGGVAIGNTAKVINEHTKLCMLLYCRPKLGKTVAAATLDELTRKFCGGRKTLFIACESADGGGTMSIQDKGVDYVMPSSFAELCSVIAALQADRTYAGVVLDNVTDVVKRFIMPQALKMPYEKGSAPASRAMGVPAQGDYQTAGEMLRSRLNELMNLTRSKDVAARKHLIVCALEKEKTDRDGNLRKIQPDLPGAMAEDAAGMFQTVASLEIRTRIADVDSTDKKKGTHRISDRVLVTSADGIKILGDRTGAFSKEGPTNLAEVWEKYFIPRIEETKEAV
jgi:hypothetical protein